MAFNLNSKSSIRTIGHCNAAHETVSGLATPAVCERRGGLAVIAGQYPLPSETFVYQEVDGLRASGCTVQTVSLHPSATTPSEVTGNTEPEPMVVYGRDAKATLRAAAVEWMCHPLRALETFGCAVMDAVVPGEKMSLASRAKLPAQAFFAIGLARRLHTVGAQHIHCHFAHAPTTIGMYAARQLGVPFSFTGHANDIFHRRVLLRPKLARASFVCCISNWHRRFYQDICPRDIEAYPIVRCGVRVDDWKSQPPRQSNAGVNVITVCRLVEKKGVRTLIEALARLQQSTDRQWRLRVVGDGPMRDELFALAQQLNCENAIEWEGAVPHARVRELLGEANVFALSCQFDRNNDRDGIPVVLMEAMACGLPVVAGDLEAIRELVQHERTGLLVDGRDAEAVATALARLIEDPELAEHLSRQGRERVMEEFSHTVNIERLTTALEAAAARKGKSV